MVAMKADQAPVHSFPQNRVTDFSNFPRSVSLRKDSQSKKEKDKKNEKKKKQEKKKSESRSRRKAVYPLNEEQQRLFDGFEYHVNIAKPDREDDSHASKSGYGRSISISEAHVASSPTTGGPSKSGKTGGRKSLKPRGSQVSPYPRGNSLDMSQGTLDAKVRAPLKVY